MKYEYTEIKIKNINKNKNTDTTFQIWCGQKVLLSFWRLIYFFEQKSVLMLFERIHVFCLIHLIHFKNRMI